MTPVDSAAVQRNGLALVMAALHHDHDAIALLLTSCTPKQLLGLAVFCAQFAAEQVRPGPGVAPGADMPAALRAVALQLASQDTTGHGHLQ